MELRRCSAALGVAGRRLAASRLRFKQTEGLMRGSFLLNYLLFCACRRLISISVTGVRLCPGFKEPDFAEQKQDSVKPRGFGRHAE